MAVTDAVMAQNVQGSVVFGKKHGISGVGIGSAMGSRETRNSAFQRTSYLSQCLTVSYDQPCRL